MISHGVTVNVAAMIPRVAYDDPADKPLFGETRPRVRISYETSLFKKWSFCRKRIGPFYGLDRNSLRQAMLFLFVQNFE